MGVVGDRDDRSQGPCPASGELPIGGRRPSPFGNAANVPDGTGTDPLATFTNSANAAQKGAAARPARSPRVSSIQVRAEYKGQLFLREGAGDNPVAATP